MGTDIPKQFLPIGGKPVLMRTLERFREYSPTLQIILVLPKAQQDYWRQLCQQYQFPLPVEEGVRGGSYLLADGGETRFHSVQNGLALIPDDAEGVVGVHDGVRPFPAIDVIRNCYETARKAKAVIPVIPIVETLRHIKAADEHGPIRTNGHDNNGSCKSVKSDAFNISETVPRGDYRLVQTPQTFDIQLLKAANRQPYNDGFTDDASVVEAFGFDITLVEGNRENIKITTPYDLNIAEMLCNTKSVSVR
jgi:2-C-methyl-D-erythritol 4-phosphate cytidylyltransferase